MVESEVVTNRSEPVELLRRPEPSHWQVGGRRSEVLANGQNLGADASEIGHSRVDLVVGFTEADHEAGFRDEACCSSSGEDAETPGVPR